MMAVGTLNLLINYRNMFKWRKKDKNQLSLSLNIRIIHFQYLTAATEKNSELHLYVSVFQWL